MNTSIITEIELSAWNQVERVEGLVLHEDFISKLVELTVKECLDAIGDNPLDLPAVHRIKARFGVAN